jgi:hypothetical protein
VGCALNMLFIFCDFYALVRVFLTTHLRFAGHKVNLPIAPASLMRWTSFLREISMATHGMGASSSRLLRLGGAILAIGKGAEIVSCGNPFFHCCICAV